jgi:diguanylate cyclase (GGDEF)-like protein
MRGTEELRSDPAVFLMTSMDPSDMHRRGRALGKTPAGGQEQDEEVGVVEHERGRPLLPEWLYALLVALIGAASVGVIVRYTAADLGPAEILIGLTALQAVNCWASGWLQRVLRAQVWQLDGALLAAGLVLLPPTGTAIALAGGALLGLALERVRPNAAVIYGCHAWLATYATAALTASVLDDSVGSWSHGLVVIAAVLLNSTVLTIAADARDRVVHGVAFWRTLREDLRFMTPRTPFIASLGYVAALAATVSMPAALLAVPSMAAMVYVLAEHFRAERDRERAETLFRTATAAHASIEQETVAAAVTEAARSLLNAQTAELRSEPPAEGELGVAMDTSDDRWLVVTGAAADPDSLLPAVAAVGASALENARLAEQLRHQAVHDALTGLPNRVLFADRVAQVAAADGRGRRFVVVVLDLDSFKKVNDSLGHAAGDELLREVAQRLTRDVRPGDTVARLSSDVFVVLLPGVETAELAGVLTEKLLLAVSRPIVIREQEVFMTACAGLAMYPDDGQEAGHLLRNADSALHRAKAEGPGSYEIYAQGMNELAHQRLARESELHQAVRRDELRVRFQPQMDLRTGRLIGVEALVRWEHPTLGMLAPYEFVPLAEESGLIVEVDTWVLRHACEQVASWIAQGLPPVRVAVNMSARHFQSPERLVGTIRDALHDTGLPAGLLELEVTEGLAVVEDRSAETLQRVRDLGVSISIDDFGTGYSMLGRLHRFPVDRLKIDRSFVREIVSSKAEAPIVSAIIAMARSLGIESVAEGIETLEQQTYLRNRGCDLGQGFLFSHPVEAVEIERMMRSDSFGLNLTPLT